MMAKRYDGALRNKPFFDKIARFEIQKTDGKHIRHDTSDTTADGDATDTSVRRARSFFVAARGDDCCRVFECRDVRTDPDRTRRDTDDRCAHRARSTRCRSDTSRCFIAACDTGCHSHARFDDRDETRKAIFSRRTQKTLRTDAEEGSRRARGDAIHDAEHARESSIEIGGGEGTSRCGESLRAGLGIGERPHRTELVSDSF